MNSLQRFTILLLVLCGASYGERVRQPGAEAASPTAPAGEQRFTFVLVHGAWAGGWEWKKCAEGLKVRGHTVYRPTLSGQGERVHLATATKVDLAMHIQDIVNFIVWEDLHDIVLVGHSYGGMVITGVVDQIPDRISHVIYLDAILPEDGESASKAMNPQGPQMRSDEEFFSLPNVKPTPPPHVVSMPVRTFTQPIELKNQDAARKVPTSYILTADDAKAPERDAFFRFYERATARGWTTEIMQGDHIVHLTKTAELVQLLERTPVKSSAGVEKPGTAK